MTAGRLKMILISILIISAMSSCSGTTSETADRIARPGNNVLPLQGVWKLTGCYTRDTVGKKNTGTQNSWDGSVISFSADGMSFGNKIWKDVRYKIKRVNTEEYFLHKYPDAVSRFGIKDREIQVVTASSQDKFLYEFVMMSNSKVIAEIDDEFYCMERASPDLKAAPGIDAENRIVSAVVSGESGDSLLRSGLLLGLRIPVKTGSVTGFRYETWWIASVNKELHTVIRANDIFLPRKDGFWSLRITREQGIDGAEDRLDAALLSSGPKSAPEKAKKADIPQSKAPSHSRTLLYIGNDYACIEDVTYMKQEGGSPQPVKVLRTLPVDNITNTDGIKFSDLTGDNGSLAFESALGDMAADMGSAGAAKADRITEDLQERNFALFRKTGHWFFKGRLNLGGGGPLTFLDFNINMIPPPDMVAYDTLQVPWTVIKDRMPQTLDAYTSPNSDIAVVLTHNEMLIYGIEKKTLSVAPLEKLGVPEGSSVIMAEWATGDYVGNWEESFVNNNAVSPASK